MQVYHLPPPEGEWVYCGRCHLAGGRFDLAKDLTSLRDDPGLPAWERQRQLRQFWAAAREAPLPAGLYPVCARLCVAPERLPRGQIGVATSEAISKLAHAFDRTGLPGKPSRPWLLTPGYDAPGHIAHFALVGDGDSRNDYVIKDVLSREGASFTEGSCDGQGAPVDLLLTSDHEAAWYLHAHNAMARLPLCLVDRVPRAWANGPRRNTAAWHPSRVVESLRVAAQVPAGRAAVLGPGVDYRKREPLALVQHLLARASPWPALAEQRLAGLPPDAAKQFISDMQLSPGSRELLRSRDPSRFAELDLAITPLAGVNIRQVPGVGWVTADEQLVCSATIQLSAVVAIPGAQARVSGVVTLDGKNIPFSASATAIDRQGLLEWLYRYLRNNGFGILRYSPIWNARALQIAHSLSTPEYRTVSRWVGWDAGRQVFRLPGGDIHRGGEIVPTAFPFGPRCPGMNLRLDGDVSRRVVAGLSERDPAVAAYWATCLGVLAHIAAPILNREPPPLVVRATRNTMLLWAAARAAGCRIVKKPYVAELHSFPIFLFNQLPRRGVLHTTPDRFVRTVSPLGASVLGWQERYWQIHAPQGWASTPWQDESTAAVLPALLRGILARPVWDAPTLLDGVAAIATNWLVSQGGEPHGITAGADLIDTPEKTSAGAHLAHAIRHVYRRRYAEVLENGLLLDVGRLRDAVHRKIPHIPADFSVLERALRRDGYLDQATETTWQLSARFEAMRAVELDRDS